MEHRGFSLRWAGTIVLLSTVIGYSVWTMNTGCDLMGYLDHASLILIVLLLMELLRMIPSDRVQSVGRFTLVAIVAVFFYMNTLHFRFFHTWGDLGAAKQWDDLHSIWNSLKVLSKPADAIFFLIFPAAAWWLSGMNPRPRLSKLTLLLLIAGLSTVHAFRVSPEILYNENDPLLYALRQKAQNHSTVSSVQGPVTDGQKYLLINSSLYKNAGRLDYPLMKIPLAHSQPLPFQLNKQPNVVFILMESVRAYESGAYGARPSLMPNLDRLAKEGFLFKNFYANSYQTVRGEYSIYSSYEPVVRGSPEYVDRPKIPVLTWPALLKRHGYSTLWIGSYTPTYDNKKEFLSNHGIDAFFWDLPKGYKKFGWGPPDEALFNYAFDTLSAQKGPYFAEIMTLSNHFPWDDGVPTTAKMPKVYGDAMYQKYAQGMFYTDYAIGKFFDRIRASRRFDNTLFVICGDHGIWLFPDNIPASATFHQEIYFRVPLIMWSPRLHPHVIDTIGSQIDIGPSVLDLLGLRDKNYFQGTSLFRQDVSQRYVLMSQDGRWNMRRGNIYTYDVGPQVFKGHYPFNEEEFDRLIKDRHMAHVDFTTDEDLLRKVDPTRLKLLSDPTETSRLHEFAEGAFAFYEGLMKAEKVVPKEELAPN